MNVHILPKEKVRILISGGYPGTDGCKGPDYPEAPPGWPQQASEGHGNGARW